MKKSAVLVAGGTGGHINAALAVGEALEIEGWEIQYLTGQRPLDYKLFKGQKVRFLNSKPLRTKNPIQFFKNVMLNFISFVAILFSFIQNRPKFVLGAGGYVCGPTLLAGYLLFIPVFIIEQNAVMGLTNRILGWISKLIFVHFSETQGLSTALEKKVRVVGNPTRKSIRPVKPQTFTGELKVLVFGGSLGAQQINNVIFDVIKNPQVTNMTIHHQIGGDQSVPAIETSIRYQALNYIEDMQKEYEWCDVIVSRSGASTISELAIIRKPVLIFPYPKATDNHQVFNAQIFEKESDFTVKILDPKLSHEACLKETQDFLVKASRQELKFSQNLLQENNTCEKILREIKAHVGMA